MAREIWSTKAWLWHEASGRSEVTAWSPYDTVLMAGLARWDSVGSSARKGALDTVLHAYDYRHFPSPKGIWTW